MTDKLFPDSEWFERNLEMLKKSPNPAAYLRGVAVVRGDTQAAMLEKALGTPRIIEKRPTKYQFHLMPVGGFHIAFGTYESIRTAVSRVGATYGMKFKTQKQERTVLVERVK